MARAALRFRRFTAAFDDAGRAREGEGEGESLADLSDLVASFLEREGVIRGGGGGGGEDEEEMRREESESSCWSDSETTKDKLLNLFRGCGDDGDAVANDLKRKIRTEVEAARGLVAKNGFSEGLKRQLVISLRLKGFDAGLCESSWDRTPRRLAGAYEFVDVNVEGMRYIVEVSLAGQFEIARPSNHYVSLVDAFPPVFIGRPEELQQVIRLMCAAMKQSLGSTGLLLPPWRKKSYMKAKWFSNHKRTAPDEAAGARRLAAVRHESLAEISYRCKDDVSSKTRPRAGHLSEIFSGGGGSNGSGA